jgi:hypothetical protein
VLQRWQDPLQQKGKFWAKHAAHDRHQRRKQRCRGLRLLLLSLTRPLEVHTAHGGRSTAATAAAAASNANGTTRDGFCSLRRPQGQHIRGERRKKGQPRLATKQAPDREHTGG